jgi:superfamily II DNA/RNA helicase
LVRKIDSPLVLLPNVFRAVYGSFDTLHVIQKQAIKPVLENQDLIIQTATGSGKTEAVLAPCLERIIQSGLTESAIYIVPTRALAFDIRRRFEPILKDRLGLGLAIRTGDMKKTGGKNPNLMLTTPESLDVMLGSSNADLQKFLLRVHTVIIDEVHPFIHQYRGCQLVYLLQRLERRTKRQLQKIALSATIADPETVSRFLNFNLSTIFLSDSLNRQIQSRLIHLKDNERELVAFMNDLHREWNYQKILIFANSRSRCDKIFTLLNQQGLFMGMVHLHYSNLNAKERQIVEHRFRQDNRAVCIATSTLELGIDVGNVDAVILFEPPDSVSAFLQRIGRANRRQNTIHFWGICQGERAGEQILRFLALLDLARQSRVETPLTKILPSVLSQQIISCLYEKKRLSLAAVQNLFMDTPDIDNDSDLKDIFQSLLKKNWFKKNSLNGLYTGGRKYWDALLEQRIWSNFPESEEEYRLEVSGETIADIPKSTVKQFEVGDRVLLVGRCLLILSIEDQGERKKVLAELTNRHEKELFWLGMGCHVSFEVAQAMKNLLKQDSNEKNELISGLFFRPGKLIREEFKKEEKAVVLDNGIEVVISNGSYRYRTFLGSVGNMILAWSARDYALGLEQQENFQIESDEIGLYSSLWIQFEKLLLPLTPRDFKSWISSHFKIMLSLFNLNAFSSTLPKKLIIGELNSFIYDPRLIVYFKQYLGGRSEVVKGDSSNLDFNPREEEKKSITFIDLPSHGSTPLLTKEKGCWTTSPAIAFGQAKKIRYRNRPLTGTIIGEYFRHQQCNRWFSIHFLFPEFQPARNTQKDNELSARRQARGQEFESKILANLNEQESLILIPEKDKTGKARSLKARFKETFFQLQQLAKKNSMTSYLGQGVLFIKDLFFPAPDFFAYGHFADNHACINTGSQADDIHPGIHGPSLDGVGIPDLIRVSVGKGKTLLEVGDIKSSSIPHYYQKWQVAFYAFLLKSLLQSNKENLPAEMADTAFLIIRSPFDNEPLHHSFKLKPYLITFKAIFRNFNNCLSVSPAKALWQLNKSCPSCSYFQFCYEQALNDEDIQFIPSLTAGALHKFRSLDLKSLKQASSYFESLSQKSQKSQKSKNKSTFTPSEHNRLQAATQALGKHKIILLNDKTRLFPANISIAFFIHLIHEPISGHPLGIGLGVKKKGKSFSSKIWISNSSENNSSKINSTSRRINKVQDKQQIWEFFSNHFIELWQEESSNNNIPHIFFFNDSIRKKIQNWARYMDDAGIVDLLGKGIDSSWTNLHQVFQNHFQLPIPGVMSFFAINQMFGYLKETEVPMPETFFHGDELPKLNLLDKNFNFLFNNCELLQTPQSTRSLLIKKDKENREILHSYLKTILSLDSRIQQWLSSILESEWHQEKQWSLSKKQFNNGQAYQDFIKAEKACKEADLQAMQKLSLKERVQRFRSLGPMQFRELTLDSEGRFLYIFDIIEDSELSKFRKGDFLKLVPLGTKNLQEGVPIILEQDKQAGQITLYSRQNRKMRLSEKLYYSLEEDGDDYNTPKLLQVLQTVYEPNSFHPLTTLLQGEWNYQQPPGWEKWIQEWFKGEGAIAQLNQSQQHALTLPFKYALGLIQGPPGTGKTNLLGWILIALVRHAQAANSNIRIAISALTHQAIDQVLAKVVNLVNKHELQNFPGRCVKLGKWEGQQFDQENQKMQVEPIKNVSGALNSSYLILGATGFGLNNMFKKQNKSISFQKIFHWVIFDEASQILIPQALLSLIFGKGNFLFLGDIHQLPPVIRSAPNTEDPPDDILENESSESMEREARKSILNILLNKYPHQSAGLDITYRMNTELCKFPSKTWYNKSLRPAQKNAKALLHLNGQTKNDLLEQILDPEKPVILICPDHQGCNQKSKVEAEILAQLASHLLLERGITKKQLAIISPHRAQNNTISCKLSELLGSRHPDLPLIDTVERVQGAERDVILFGFTCSDPDYILNDFLNNPNRFNVAITRARKKLIVVGSKIFFSTIASTEHQLKANACFKDFFEYCRENNCCFELNQDYDFCSYGL